MDILDIFTKELECDYKEEHYRVRDNGSVLRLPPPNKKPRKLDNVWTFGTKSSKTGYMTIGTHRIHIIVATAFYGSKDSKVYVVDHIDTNRCNNRAENLRWLTRLENVLLNPISRAKIEYLCGSVEEFLNDTSILKGHESEDRNFAWMRTVTKEEAENTLKNWHMLLSQSQNRVASNGLGEWMYRDISTKKPSLLDEILGPVDRQPITSENDKIKTKENSANEIKPKTKDSSKPKVKKTYKIIHEPEVVESDIKVKAIKVRFIPINCYNCGCKHYVYMTLGLISDDDTSLANLEGFWNADIEYDEFNIKIVSAVKHYLSQHKELNYKMGEIKERFSNTRNETYYSFGCPNCDSILGDHYLHELQMDYIYEPENEFVHIIELEEPGLIIRKRTYL